MKQKEYNYITVTADESEPTIIIGVYKPKLEIDINVAKELVDNRLDFTNGENHYILVDFTNVKSVTKEARDYMNDPKGGLKGLLAGAFLSNSLVTTLFINMYLKINQPTVPAKFFTKKDEAINWLKGLKASKKT
jgi:hypothetical protein